MGNYDARDLVRVDLSDPYITFTNEYMESVWWALKRYFDGGMIYKG